MDFVLFISERAKQAEGYGTGSYPPSKKGLQRNIRKMDRKSPLIIPCFVKASIAYMEHVGINLQEGGK